MTTPTSILFDLDGTLTDRRQTLGAMASALRDEFAPTMPQTSIHECLINADADGRRRRPAFFAELRSTLTWRDTPSAGALETFWRRTLPSHTALASNARQTLESLASAGVPMGLISNGGRGQRRKLEALGIAGFFRAVLISAEVGQRKPSPAMFRLALQAIDVSPERACFVGDDPYDDIAGARSAGLCAIWKRNAGNWPAELPPPDARIDDLAELKSVLAGG